ncbi:non-specific lipid transfer protein GPI-anchored 6-like [Rutidosis leptorrhynchoides]|uniref:non-specific lipid transfer protein GPI-anchored 6-like n=1 Tax=Rutidosis leptorrhynchoides TaxID=125765 RepID=UPI003A9A5204
MSQTLLIWLAMVMVLVNLSKGDFEQDKANCAQIIIGLSTCLPYVTSQSKAPTVNCCNSLKTVLQKSKVCLCILIKDRDDPNLPVKINATLALGLPDTCKAPSNITECPMLMNLPPNSPEAKIFLDWGKNAKTSNATADGPSANASNGKVASNGGVKSDAGRGKNWLGVKKYWWLLNLTIIMFLLQIA